MKTYVQQEKSERNRVWNKGKCGCSKKAGTEAKAGAVDIVGVWTDRQTCAGKMK